MNTFVILSSNPQARNKQGISNPYARNKLIQPINNLNIA